MPTKEQVRQKEINSLKEAVQNMEKVAKTLPADQQKDFKASIDMYQGKIKEYQDPNNKMIEMIWQGQVEEGKRVQQRYQEATKKWETDYPVDHKLFVKARLQHYLDVAKTVDFSAALVEKYGKMRFVNQTYQGKNNEWKMIFRAGKGVYEETRPFAEQWVKEL
jgi:alkylated DNA repair dioxygenase AlkB